MLDKKSYLIGLSGGGGGEPITEEINITANGTYTPREGVDGYNSVKVNVAPILHTTYSWRNYTGGNHKVLNAGTYRDPVDGKIKPLDGFATPFNINIPPERMLQTMPTITENGTYTPSWGKVVYDLRTKNDVLYQIDVLLDSQEEFDSLPTYKDAILALPCIQDFMAAHNIATDDVNYIGTAIFMDTSWPLRIDGWMPQITVDVQGGGADWTSELRSCNNMFSGNTTMTEPPMMDTSNVTNMNGMFKNCSSLKSVPQYDTSNVSDMQYMFNACQSLESIPDLQASKLNNVSYMFSNCYELEYLPNLIGYNAENASVGQGSFVANNCYSLRTLPDWFVKLNKNNVDGSSCIINGKLSQNYSLDGIRNIAVYSKTLTSSVFNALTSVKVPRLGYYTFETNADGTAIEANWKSQTLDFAYKSYGDNTYVGNFKSASEQNYNTFLQYTKISPDKRVKDAATYEALKNDPDWFTCDVAYSRYNKTSAVETINSLPDTSAYLATAGGTNTIKFKGNAGSATDGGAINTMTEAEIAVAAAKGWTVSFV